MLHKTYLYYTSPLLDLSLFESFTCKQSPPREDIPYLHMNVEGLSAIIPSLKKPFQVSFTCGQMQRRARQANELLYRATVAHKKIKGESLHLIDATAGLGREAFLLASAGARVDAIERNITLFQLTQDALKRSVDDTRIMLNLIHMDSCVYLSQHQADIIYLDPMFPPSKKSAAVGKEAQVLQAFVRHDTHEEESGLLMCALQSARYRVVVKRPIKSSPLADRKPTSSINGKNIRYDIYGICKIPKV
jgi:hypothetical protein